MSRRARVLAAVLVSLAGLTGCAATGQAPPAAAGADDRCGQFRFAAEGERALFAGTVSRTTAAGGRPGTGPELTIGRLYALRRADGSVAAQGYKDIKSNSLGQWGIDSLGVARVGEQAAPCEPLWAPAPGVRLTWTRPLARKPRR